MISFSTDEERKTAQAILKDGRITEFWKLIVRVMEESKIDIQQKQDSEEIGDLPADQYKLQNEIFKAKKDLIKKIIDTPESLIAFLEEPDNKEVNYDPFYTKEELSNTEVSP